MGSGPHPLAKCICDRKERGPAPRRSAAIIGAAAQLLLVLLRSYYCKLAVVVVELHVGPSDSVMRSGIKIRYLLCSAAFLKEPLLGALSSCMTCLDLTEGDKLALLGVELHVGRGDSVMRSELRSGI